MFHWVPIAPWPAYWIESWIDRRRRRKVASVISFSSDLKIFLYAGPVDMRKSYDGLYGIVGSEFERDVRDGGLFLFINRRRDRLKLLYWHQDGLVIWMKRLEGGRLQHPQPAQDAKYVTLDATDFQMLISGIELTSVKRRPRYRRSA